MTGSFTTVCVHLFEWMDTRASIRHARHQLVEPAPNHSLD